MIVIMIMITRRLGALLLTAIAVPALASCSFSIGGTSIDHDKLNKSITDFYNKDLQPRGYSVSDVTCDDPGKNPEDGTTFKCVVTAGSSKFDVKATVAEPDIKFETDGGVLYEMASLSTKLTDAAGKQVPGIKVACGQGLKVYPAGTTFDCDATGASGERGVIVYSVTDKGANDRWELK